MSLPAVLTRNVCTQFDCVHLNQARKLLLLAKLQLWRREEKKKKVELAGIQRNLEERGVVVHEPSRGKKKKSNSVKFCLILWMQKRYQRAKQMK